MNIARLNLPYELAVALAQPKPISKIAIAMIVSGVVIIVCFFIFIAMIRKCDREHDEAEESQGGGMHDLEQWQR